MILLNGPSEEQLKLIKAELNEDDDRLKHNVELLRTWIAYQDHLPKNYDPELLVKFLRGCKHDLERAKRKFELYFSVRKSVSVLYSNRNTTSDEARTAAKTFAIIPLPDLNKDGCRVTLARLMNSDVSLFNIQHIVRLFIMIGDIRLIDERNIAGDIIVVDMGNNGTVAHLAKIANTVVSKGLTVAHEAYPQRLKRMHIINFPEFGEKLINLFKSFVKEKIRNRFVIHRKQDELADYVTQDILPNEYGGKAGDLATLHEQWQNYLIKKNDWFQEQETITAIGPIPKHLSHSCALDINESIHGSFRKLAID